MAKRDFYEVLGVAKDAPVGFAAIRLRFDIATDADEGTAGALEEVHGS